MTYAIVAAFVAAVSLQLAPAPPAVPSTSTSPTLPGVLALSARLVDSQTGETLGAAAYKEIRFGIRLEQKLSVKIVGQRADTVIDVKVNDTLVGRLRTDKAGEAKGEFSGPTWTRPTALPRIRKGSVIAVGSAKGEF